MKNSIQLECFKEPVQEIILRDQQILMLQACRDAFQHTRKFILKAGCGTGKTVLAAYFIQQAVENGYKCLFVVDRITLAEHTNQEFEKYGIDCGIIQADNPKYHPNLPVQIGSIQTLNRRSIKQYGLIIIDEAHCIYVGHKKLFTANPEAFVIGLTATPYAVNLGKYFDFFIEPIPVKEMIDQGALVPFEIYGPDITDLSKLRTKAGEYTEESLSVAYDQFDIVGDVVTTWEKVTPGEKTIVFGVNVAHIKHLAEEFNRRNILACQINAYQSEIERKTALDGFLEGETTVLCSVEVATKGFDCPEVSVVALAMATKSHMKWEQTCGRGFRLFPGKEKCTILDFGGNCARLGYPDEYYFPELSTGKKKKKKKKVEDDIKLPVPCPACHFLKPAGVRKCPACGFVLERQSEVEAAPGELKKLERKGVGKKKQKEYSVQDKQDFLSQLNKYADLKGYKKSPKGCYGWAIYTYKEKFGVLPANNLTWNAQADTVGDKVQGFITHMHIKKAYARKNKH